MTSRCVAIGEGSNDEMGTVPTQPSGRKGVTNDYFVIRRRRWCGIDSSSLLHLVSQAPPANANLFLGQGTRDLQLDKLPKPDYDNTDT